MTTAKFIYKKTDGSESPRLVLGVKIIKDIHNEMSFLDHQDAKYLTGWEIDANGISKEELENYLETVKDFLYEEVRLKDYLKQNGLNPDKVKYKTFAKDSIKNIILF